MDEKIRKTVLGDKSVYAEHGNITINYGDKKINKILGTPPFFPDIFLGREEDLKAVYKKLFEGENLLLLVNGEGGIGKTTFAAKYWQKYQDEYKHLAWVFAQKSILDALLTLGVPLNVKFSDGMTSEQMLEAVLSEMANLDKPSLLVIDNANDVHDLEKYYLALRSVPNFHLILTSRITGFENAESYQIKPLEEEDAIRLFKRHYPKHRDSENGLLKGIRKAVGGNTLVLELLAKNLYALNTDELFYSLEDLLHDLQKLGLLRLSQSEKVSISGKGNHFSLKKAKPEDIIKALYDEVEMVKPLTAYEQNLLSNLSVLPAENMPYALLKELLQPEDARLFSNTLTDLAKRGWIEKEVEGQLSFYKISPVVQEITRHKNKKDLLNHCEKLINSLIKKLEYEPGTGHFLYVSYEAATLFARYAESISGIIKETGENLAILCERIGNFHKTTGNLQQALKFYQDFNRLEKELYEAFPQNVDYKNNLAVSCQFLGRTHTTLGNLQQALKFYQDFNRLEKELHETFPQNVDYKNNLAVSYQFLGFIHAALGNLQQALKFYLDHNRLEKELYDAFPSTMSFKNGLAVSYQFLGNTYSNLGNLEKALTFYQDFNRLEKELHETFPQNMEFKNLLAISYGKLGETHTALGNLQQALKFYQTDLELTKKLFEGFPQNMEFKNGLAIAYQHLGIAHTELGSLQQALTFYQDFNRLEEELHETFPQNMEFKNLLAISYQFLGIMHSALGNLQQALKFYKDFNLIEKELHGDFPQNVEFKNLLAISYLMLGQLYETKKNDMACAMEYYRPGKVLLDELMSQFPDYVHFKQNLDWVNNRLDELGGG